MIVTNDNYPRLYRAFRMIECDGGAHLIGTVYPGDPIDLGRFNVPEAWQHLVAGAEAGLTHLISGSEALFETFVSGDQDEAERLIESWGNLSEAHILLNDFFEGWPPENVPFAASGKDKPPTPTAELKEAEEAIRRILLDIQERTGRLVDQVSVDTRNFANCSVEIFLTKAPALTGKDGTDGAS